MIGILSEKMRARSSVRRSSLRLLRREGADRGGVVHRHRMHPADIVRVLFFDCLRRLLQRLPPHVLCWWGEEEGAGDSDDRRLVVQDKPNQFTRVGPLHNSRCRFSRVIAHLSVSFADHYTCLEFQIDPLYSSFTIKPIIH